MWFVFFLVSSLVISREEQGTAVAHQLVSGDLSFSLFLRHVTTPYPLADWTMRRWFGAFLILSLASCGEKLGHVVDLSQLEWTVACQSGRVQPCLAEVPGHVLPSLVNAGLAPNPDHGTHERDVQWVEDETWTYSTKLPPTHMAGMDSAVLTFQGLDTYARVLVGDQWVLSAENAHRSWTSLPFTCSDDSLTLRSPSTLWPSAEKCFWTVMALWFLQATRPDRLGNKPVL